MHRSEIARLVTQHAGNGGNRLQALIRCGDLIKIADGEELEEYDDPYFDYPKLAKVCNTTRKTIYNWLGGTGEPQERNRERLFVLDVLADDWAGAGYSTDRVILKRPSVDGRSVFEMLCEDPIDSDLVFFAGSRIALHDRRSPLADPFSRVATAGEMRPRIQRMETR